jgi:hypothetical protein
MTPQSQFMVLASLARSNVERTRKFLSTMNAEPGKVDPLNPLCPFGRLQKLHFARFIILDDRTTGDIHELYGVERVAPPVYLAFLGDFDGPYDSFLRDLIAVAGPGLREIFSLCEDFTPSSDLETWMLARNRKPATQYCNWIGRTVLQCREESALRNALRERLDACPALADAAPREVHRSLREFALGEKNAGRLPLTEPEDTPLLWGLSQCWRVVLLIVLPLAAIVAFPLTLLILAVGAVTLRRHETSDREYAPRPDPQWAAGLAALEDYTVTNQFSALGSLKPGLFRRVLLRLILFAINLTTFTIFTQGRLARVHTIHFARWVYLDGGTRLFFASNYDGSLESYMDDFINKVAFGLNVVFSNGVGYPKTDWLFFKGAKNEQLFKYFIRRHELPTEVWYNALDGLTASNLECNSLIRQGLEELSMPDRELNQWVALL